MNEWMSRAACRDVDPDIFFPVGSRGPALAQAAAARAVCNRCPVTEACLRWVQAHPQDTGIWAGLDADERRARDHERGPGDPGPAAPRGVEVRH